MKKGAAEEKYTKGCLFRVCFPKHFTESYDQANSNNTRHIVVNRSVNTFVIRHVSPYTFFTEFT